MSEGAVSTATASVPTIRRRAAALNEAKPVEEDASGNTMMRLYPDESSTGLKVDPVIVLVLAVVFIFSVVFLHLFTKLAKKFA